MTSVKATGPVITIHDASPGTASPTRGPIFIVLAPLVERADPQEVL